MASVELSWTVDGKDHADVVLGYDPATLDSSGNAVATSASGTYQILDASDNVIRTDQITGLIPANAYILGPDDVLNITGQASSITSYLGVGVIIDNAADADDIVGGLQNAPASGTPQVLLGSVILGGYYELDKGDATDVTLQDGGSSPPPNTGPTSGDGVTVTTRANGSHLVRVSAPGQTLQSDYVDTFRVGGQANTHFVFDPGYSHDTIDGFALAGGRHDTLDLLASDFAGDTRSERLADVLRHTHEVGGNAVIADPTSGDKIALTGITKADLTAHKGDFAFHA
jgi:hypothetical protein